MQFHNATHTPDFFLIFIYLFFFTKQSLPEKADGNQLFCLNFLLQMYVKPFVFQTNNSMLNLQISQSTL